MFKKLLLFPIFFFFSFDSLMAFNTPPEPPKPPTVVELIEQYSEEYEVPYRLAYKLAKFESRLSPMAVNPTTGAGGLFQWLASSWKIQCEPKYEDRFDAVENMACALDVISKSKYGIRHWTADLKVRRMLVNAGFVICYEGKNNCELKKY